jgi:phosphoserine phosphatase
MYRACRQRVFAFDMDGTLLPGTTACLQIAREAGVENELADLEDAFARGEITTLDFAGAISALWDSSDHALIRRAFDASPKLKGIRQAVKAISMHGGRTCVITLSPRYFAEHFRDFGFDEIAASTFPSSPQQPLQPREILTPESKIDCLRAICARHNCAYDDAVAFGDSASDIPLFASLRWSICLNGSQRLKQTAWMSHEGDDLPPALERALAALSAADRGSDPSA